MRGVCHGIVDFVVGDDLWIAVAVAVLLATGAVLVGLGANAWWLLPLGVPAALWSSLVRARHKAARTDS